VKGYRVELEKGGRAVYVFKHPKKDTYLIRGETGGKTQKIVLSGEAIDAIGEMLERVPRKSQSDREAFTVEPYTEPPHWMVVEPAKKRRGKK
jgi:hypothetical protein